MGKMSKARETVTFLRDCDDLLRFVTGKRSHQLLARGLDLLFGDEAKAALSSAIRSAPEEPPDSPYRVLGVRPDAGTIVVKAAFRSLAKDLHPDTGSKPNPGKFQQVVDAYNRIMALREEVP